jgi:hypothetical protein
MQNLSDDELDNLFRKAAEDLKPPYEPAHWNDLDQKLSSSSSTKRSSSNKGWMWGAIVAVLLITTTGTLLMINQHTSSEKLATSSSYDNGLKKEQIAPKDVKAIHKHSDNPSVPSSESTLSVAPLEAGVENSENSKDSQITKSANASSSGTSATGNLNATLVEKNKSTTPPGANSKNPDEKSARNAPMTSSEKQNVSGKPVSGTPTRRAIASQKNEKLLTTAPVTLQGNKPESAANMTNTFAEVTDDNPPAAADEEVSTEQKIAADLDKKEGDNSRSVEQHRAGVGPDGKGRIVTDVERPSTTHRPVVAIEIKDSDNSSVAEQASGQETGNNKEALQAKSDDGNVRGTTASPAVVSDLQLDSVNSVEKPSDESVEEQQTKETKETYGKNLSTPRLSLKIALSPDYSSVRYSSFTRSGTNYGILVDYHFTPRWSVSAGALSSRKIYTASNVEYHGYTADQADGDCRIIDIPINVYYNFKIQRSISFYAGLGISSYIMNSEKYEFRGKNYAGSYSYTQKVEGENNELFSVINLSAGVQKQLTDRWAIQLEPFVKQSIKGIGEGDLSLSSLGAFLNLRYTIIKVNNP